MRSYLTPAKTWNLAKSVTVECVGAGRHPVCPAKKKVSLDLVMEASLTESAETVKALSAMARDAFIR
ncbi:hypothetical protein OKW40_003354 [Paraburkholderia sp. RAU6.4a]|nr:hypothetical protein [Paraburkholderia sp. HC6.4b]MBB5450762.1 hypothetical protein [Paraburkholderia sp. Kb1A]